MKSHSLKTSGFTLVEMAIVLVIVGLLLGGLLMPLSTQIEQRRIGETQKALEEIKEALIGFAIANGRLPCPAPAATPTGAAGAGLEATTGTGSALTCTVAGGNGVIPWATLGVNETDAWGRRYSYRVTILFARGLTQVAFGAGCTPVPAPTQAAFALCTQGDNNILVAAAGTPLAGAVPAVVVSHGTNGLGAFSPSGTQVPGAAADELENANGNATFISHVPSNAAGNPYDDIVTWVSPNILFNRMVTAGKLP